MRCGASEPRTLVVGYGSPLRGDDAAGWAVARRLEELHAGDDVRVMSLHQLTPELAEDASRVELVIFIDASVEDAPGAVRIGEVVPEESDGAVMAHHLTPGRVLGLARGLYGRCARGVLVSIGAASFDLSESLSDAVARAVEEAVEKVEGIVLGSVSPLPEGEGVCSLSPRERVRVRGGIPEASLREEGLSNVHPHPYPLPQAGEGAENPHPSPVPQGEGVCSLSTRERVRVRGGIPEAGLREEGFSNVHPHPDALPEGDGDRERPRKEVNAQ